MAALLPDTNVLIRFLRGQREYVELFHSILAEDHLLASCPITVAEVFAGMKTREEPVTRRLLESLHYFVITPEVAESAGRLRSEWNRRGRTLSLADTLIAATAIHYGCTLVTQNVKDFPMPGLRLLAV